MSGITVFAYLLAGFALAAVTGAVLLRILPLLQFKQVAYEDAPASHQQKTGTPTMGGLVFIAALLPLFFTVNAPFASAIVFLVFACGTIGLLDDYLSIRRGKNLGLRARTKYLATALVAVLFLWQIQNSTDIFPRDVLLHTATYALVVPHWFWLLLGVLAISGTIHAVNLTDGLDGLAAGTMIPPLLVVAAVCAPLYLLAPLQAVLLGIGGCLGFLVYNRFPAKMFMGDTGSLALGALLAGTAIVSGEMLLLLLIGGVYVAETLSVIIQVTYFKLTHGKRIFRMSPLHHHFELSGWPEQKVTTRFWLASLLCSLLGWAVVR